MTIGNISLIGWLHSVACLVALASGAWNLALPKGTAMHRLVGRWYFYTMLVVNLSVFAVYHFDIAYFRPFTAGANIFGVFHWEAVATLLLLALGVYAAPRQDRAAWAYAHPVAMLLTYYMLIGGLINELFVRVPVLRDFARAHAPHAANLATSPVVGMVQGLAMLLFAVLILYVVIKTAFYRRRLRIVVGGGAAATA